MPGNVGRCLFCGIRKKADDRTELPYFRVCQQKIRLDILKNSNMKPVLLALFLFSTLFASAQRSIPLDSASSYVNQYVCICSKANIISDVTVSLGAESKPPVSLTILTNKFKSLSQIDNRNICVTGRLWKFQNLLLIRIDTATQIKLQGEPTTGNACANQSNLFLDTLVPTRFMSDIKALISQVNKPCDTTLKVIGRIGYSDSRNNSYTDKKSGIRFTSFNGDTQKTARISIGCSTDGKIVYMSYNYFTKDMVTRAGEHLTQSGYKMETESYKEDGEKFTVQVWNSNDDYVVIHEKEFSNGRYDISVMKKSAYNAKAWK
jgi:hypothetical protein